MKLVATIYERTQAAALDAIRALPPEHDMVEVRLDAFNGGDPSAFRGVTQKPILFTNRGGEPPETDFGLIDVEYGRRIRDPERTVLSFHDFAGMPDLQPLVDAMTAFGCAHTKIAVTPQTLRQNEALLALIRPGLTIIGMGERGLYSRILAPFFGSELFFAGNAAPGQISLERAIAIYGDRHVRRPEKIFAIAGNPAGHSLSPSKHNALFRQAGVRAAYTIASFESFEEIARALLDGTIAGLSVTAPFKEEAFRFAQAQKAEILPNAELAEAVNTLVRHDDGRIVAENTDVDGFIALMHPPYPRRAAVVGAGGTGRAARVALDMLNAGAVVYNRTPKPGTLPLDQLPGFKGDLVIDTLPNGVRVDLPKGIPVIAAAYDRGGLELFHAQAGPQNRLFLEVFR
jgi:3-dehydroquinate dehydratase